MGRKIDFNSSMKRAMSAPTPDAIKPDRFAKAEGVLKERPTGFSAPASRPAEPELTTEASSAAPTTSAAPPASVTNDRVTAQSTAPVLTKVNVEKFGVNDLGAAEYREVLISQTIENPYNARFVYRPEKLAEMRASIASNGQLVPGLANYRDGQYILIAAHYRRKALLLEGMQTIKLMVYENLTDQQMYLLSYIENTRHSGQTTLDNARGWRRLLDDNVFDSDMALAEAIGESKATISKTLSVLDLDPAVLSVIEQDPAKFGMSVTYELVLLQKAASPAVAAEMAVRVYESGLGRREIAATRERYAQKGVNPPKRPYETSRSYSLWDPSVDRKLGQIKEWDSGKVSIEITFGDNATKQRFIEEVRSSINGKLVAKDVEAAAPSSAGVAAVSGKPAES